MDEDNRKHDSKEVPIIVSDLKDIRITLMGVQQYLQAKDIMYSQSQLLDPVRYSPMTNMVGQALDRVSGILGDYYLNVIEDEDEIEDTIDEVETVAAEK